MRTTLTLDDDLHADLVREAQRTGRSFRDVLNTALRGALSDRGRQRALPKFRVEAHDMGLRTGLSYDDVAALVEHAEGPGAR